MWAEKDGYDRAQHGSRKTDKTVKQDNANKAKPLEKMHWGSGSAMWVMPVRLAAFSLPDCGRVTVTVTDERGQGPRFQGLAGGQPQEVERRVDPGQRSVVRGWSLRHIVSFAWTEQIEVSVDIAWSCRSAEFAQLADYFMLNRRKFWHCRLFEGLLAQMVLYNHHS